MVRLKLDMMPPGLSGRVVEIGGMGGGHEKDGLGWVGLS